MLYCSIAALVAGLNQQDWADDQLAFDGIGNVVVYFCQFLGLSNANIAGNATYCGVRAPIFLAHSTTITVDAAEIGCQIELDLIQLGSAKAERIDIPFGEISDSLVFACLAESIQRRTTERLIPLGSCSLPFIKLAAFE